MRTTVTELLVLSPGREDACDRAPCRSTKSRAGVCLIALVNLVSLYVGLVNCMIYN